MRELETALQTDDGPELTDIPTNRLAARIHHRLHNPIFEVLLVRVNMDVQSRRSVVPHDGESIAHTLQSHTLSIPTTSLACYTLYKTSHSFGHDFHLATLNDR